MSDAPGGVEDVAAEEEVDGLPILAPSAAAQPATPAPLPGRQAAMVAATGFAAGAATVALVHRRRVSRLVGRGARRRKPKGMIGEVLASNSFLVDVHLLRRG